MKIFVVNCGSSSIKCFLYDFKDIPHHSTDPLWEAHLEWKGDFKAPLLKVKSSEGKELLEKADVIATPGNGFGESGEGFVRMALTVDEARLKEAAKHGFRRAIVPCANAPKQKTIKGLEIIAIDRLSDAIEAIHGL